MSEELARAAIATLYLVADEHSAIFLAGFGEPLGKLLGSDIAAAHSLDALQDTGAHIALGKLTLPRLQVVVGKEGHMPIVVDRRYYLRITRHLHGQ